MRFDTIAEVATSPPTPAHKRTRNWMKPGLHIGESTFGVISFKIRWIPVLRDLDLQRRQVILEINARGSMGPLRMVDWPHMVLHAVLVRQLQSNQLMLI